LSTFGSVAVVVDVANVRTQSVSHRRPHTLPLTVVRSFVCLFVRSFVRSFVRRCRRRRSFVDSFVCSFVRSFVRCCDVLSRRSCAAAQLRTACHHAKLTPVTAFVIVHVHACSTLLLFVGRCRL